MSGWIKHDPMFTTDSTVSTDGLWRYSDGDPSAPVCGATHPNLGHLGASCGRRPHPIGGPHILVSAELIGRGVRLFPASEAPFVEPES